MPTLSRLPLGLIAAIVASTALVQPVLAHDLDLVVQARGGAPGKPGGGGGGGGEDDGGGGSTRTPIYYNWMHSDLPGAWNIGTGNEYLGQGSTTRWSTISAAVMATGATWRINNFCITANGRYWKRA